MDHLARDIRNGLRLLRHAPIFTAVPIVSLGLGIGPEAQTAPEPNREGNTTPPAAVVSIGIAGAWTG
jgi:hypothetical protein